jgi:hypothetical protein
LDGSVFEVVGAWVLSTGNKSLSWKDCIGGLEAQLDMNE